MHHKFLTFFFFFNLVCRILVAARGIGAQTLRCGARASLVVARGLLSSCAARAPECVGSVVAAQAL